MKKKILYLSMILLIGLSLLTGCGKNVEKKETTGISYSIGELVALVDGSIWYVIENSDASSDTVTLFARKNIKNDASGWTKKGDEYEIAFDEANARTTEKNSYCTEPQYGCNIYAANGSTVTEDSSIKKFLEGNVTTYINNSLTSNGGININSIRLLTMDEYDTLGTSITINYTDYWTMTQDEYNSYYVYYINYRGSGGLNHNAAYEDYLYGARPVIVTNKSNIEKKLIVEKQE